MKNYFFSAFLGLALFSPHPGAAQSPAPAMEFSRLVIYDVRGPDREETALILEQKGTQVKVWFQNYLGKRTGEMPYGEYLQAFAGMRSIKQFALKPKYRGRLLRKNAAHGMVTLAWKDEQGKQIQSIKYYAPENTLDDFRQAYNRIWALSRYAILSLESFASPRREILEDAIYFLSGAGWMTLEEIQSVVEFYRQRGQDLRIAGVVWGALDLNYSSSSEFSRPAFLEHCVKMCMLHLNHSAGKFLQEPNHLQGRHGTLAAKILEKLQ